MRKKTGSRFATSFLLKQNEYELQGEKATLNCQYNPL